MPARVRITNTSPAHSRPKMANLAITDVFISLQRYVIFFEKRSYFLLFGSAPYICAWSVRAVASASIPASVLISSSGTAGCPGP